MNDGTDVGPRGAQRRPAAPPTSRAPGLDLQRYEAAPGRTSLVGRIEGTDPEAPTLLLMGHTDVVPVTRTGWRHDPFGGELIDGEVWGRGAVDMLNLTASMAIAIKYLADTGSGRRAPSSTWPWPTRRPGDLRGLPPGRPRPGCGRADYVITESGGIPIPSRPGSSCR